MIKPENIILSFLTSLNEAYKKYHNDEEYLLEKIATHIPKITNGKLNIFIYHYLNSYSDTIIKPTLAKYEMLSIDDFNPTVSLGFFSSDGYIATTSAEESNMHTIDPTPTPVLIAYNNNGQPIEGQYEYDSEELMEYNAHLHLSPARDYHDIYVKDDKGHYNRYNNDISTIYFVKMNGLTLYFETFNQLKTHMLKYIHDNSN